MNQLQLYRQPRMPEDVRDLVDSMKGDMMANRQVEAHRDRNYVIRNADGSTTYIEEELHIQIREW